MKEENLNEIWLKNLERIFTKEAIDIFSNKIEYKDYLIDYDVSRKFCYAFLKDKKNFLIFGRECDILGDQTLAIRKTEVYFKFFYYIWKNWETEKEIFELFWKSEAAFFAEMFFIRWMSYFDKLAHIINISIGHKLESRHISFSKIIEEISENPNELSSILKYLSKIPKTRIYDRVRNIRNELVHNFYTYFKLGVSSIPGGKVKKGKWEDRKIPDHVWDKYGKKLEGPMITISYESPQHTIGEIWDIIDDATDLLVEIKLKVLEYADEIGYKAS